MLSFSLRWQFQSDFIWDLYGQHFDFRNISALSSAWMPWRAWSCATKTGTVRRPGQAISGSVLAITSVHQYNLAKNQTNKTQFKYEYWLKSCKHWKVDFDKTKHLAESSTKQRKAERERIINEERSVIHYLCIMHYCRKIRILNCQLHIACFKTYFREKERQEKRQKEIEEMQKNQQL